MESVRQLCRELRWTGSPVAIKLGSLCGSTPTVLTKICLQNPFENTTLACVKYRFIAINHNPSVLLPCISFFPSRVPLDLLSTFVLTPIYCCFRGGSRLRRRGRRVRAVSAPGLPVELARARMLSLARYSEPDPDPVLVLLWSIVVVFLLMVIVFLECPPRRVVR